MKQKKELEFNPFFDSGIASYEQFKQFPFLVSSKLRIINNRIDQEIQQIKNNYFFSDRLILLGYRGIGKTSTLFFIKDKLDNAELKTIFFSTLFESMQHFSLLSTVNLWKESENKPVYILVDFPDSLDTQAYKNFLLSLWKIITHKNYAKINLIFAMNRSHYDKSFLYSEILGKFTTVSLEPLNFEETSDLIKSRLKIAGNENYFSDEVIEKIFNYSKGIPRNIISACNLVYNYSDGAIDSRDADKVLEEEFLEQVINDRIEDPSERLIYKGFIDILKNDFNKKVTSQEEYIEKIKEKMDMSRATIMKKINYLTKLGIFKISKGGKNRVNKIISID